MIDPYPTLIMEALPAGTKWHSLGLELQKELNLELKFCFICTKENKEIQERLSHYYLDPNNKFWSTLGISSKGAVLVRADGHVGWRSTLEVNSRSKESLKRGLASVYGLHIP